MILSSMLGSNFGGLEKVFLDQLRLLPAAGLAVRGIVRRDSPAARRARSAKLLCTEVPIYSDWDPFTLRSVRAALSGGAASQPARLVLCHGRKAHRIVARAKDSRLPLVAMIHKPDFDRALRADAYVVVAEHRRRSLIEAGIEAGRIAVVPNAVALPQSGKSNYALGDDGTMRIAGLGRLHAKKGFSILIDALAILKTTIPFTCAIAGDGPEREALRAQVRARGLEQNVRLEGWVDDIAGFLARADVFAFPSLQEDFPLAMLEAMACGIPMAANRIDGPKDVLEHERTALLVEPGSAAALAAALLRLAGDVTLRARLGAAARARVQNDFSPDRSAGRLAAVLENVAMGRRPEAGLAA